MVLGSAGKMAMGGAVGSVLVEREGSVEKVGLCVCAASPGFSKRKRGRLCAKRLSVGYGEAK